MKRMFPVLKFNEKNEIEDGSIIEALPYCKENCNRKSCSKFYSQLQYAENGFYICPTGLSAYVSSTKDSRIIYTCMRIKGHYNKKSTQILEQNGLADKCFDPVIGEEMFFRLKACDTQMMDQESVVESTKNIHAELLHDIRKICAHIKNKSEDIIRLDEYAEEVSKSCNVFETLQRVKNIEALASIATSRFDVYDISMNPATMCYGNRRIRTIYQKFHKAKYMLTNYMDKGIDINLLGRSTFEFPVYQTFDALPFILLENAVKYAPSNSSINVSFREEHNNLYISIVSEGPTCTQDELDNLFIKGFRGSAAERTKTSGNGVGLYLAKEICDAHDIKISVSSRRSHNIHGIPYGDFEVDLTFFH